MFSKKIFSLFPNKSEFHPWDSCFIGFLSCTVVHVVYVRTLGVLGIRTSWERIGLEEKPKCKLETFKNSKVCIALRLKEKKVMTPYAS